MEKDGWRERLMANTKGGAIPLRQFGRHQVRISALGFGGHHLGDAPDERTAVRLVREAVDGGITFFENRTPYPPACSRRAGGLSPVIPTRPAGVGAMVRRGPKGLSKSNVRQNATVCIRGEPLSAGSPAGRDFSAAARNSSQVLAHSRVTLLFFRPRLGEMLQDAGQPQHGGRAGRVLRPGPRLAIGTTRLWAAHHVFRGEGGPRRQAGPAAGGQISPQATDIAINSSKETD